MGTPTPGTRVRMRDGTQEELRFDFAAFYAAEDESGMAFAELQARLAVGSVKAIATLLWAGLLWVYPERRVRDWLPMLDMKQLGEYGDAIGDAVLRALPEAEVEEAKREVVQAATAQEARPVAPGPKATVTQGQPPQPNG